MLDAIFERDIVIFNEGEVIPRKYGVRLGQQATWGLEPTRTSVATVKALKFAAVIRVIIITPLITTIK